MQVRQEWKSHTHVIRLSWGDSKKLKIELTSTSMVLSPSPGVDPDICTRLMRSYVLHRDNGTYGEFRQRVCDLSASTDSLAKFLEGVES